MSEPRSPGADPMARALRSRRVSPLTATPLTRPWPGWARQLTARACRRERLQRPGRMEVLQRARAGASWRIGGNRWVSHVAHVRAVLAVNLQAGPGQPLAPVARGGQVPGPRLVTRVSYRAHAGVPGSAAGAVAGVPVRGHVTRAEPMAGRPRAVLARATVGRAAVASGPRSLATVTAAPVRAAVRHLAQGRRRVESAPRQVPAQVGRSVAADVPGVASPRKPGPSAPEARPVPGSGFVPAGRQDGGAFDLDRLTDQIVTRLDDRLTAHRERFGRGF